NVLDGFDETTLPNWLMVPFRGTNRVRLVNDARFSLLTNNRSVATVERVGPDLIEVRGVGLGPDARISVVDGAGHVVAVLEVSVKQRRVMTTAFLYVVNPGVGTARNPGDEVAFLQVMNQIYLPQTNIEFLRVSARRVTISDNLGTEVNTIGNF